MNCNDYVYGLGVTISLSAVSITVTTLLITFKICCKRENSRKQSMHTHGDFRDSANHEINSDAVSVGEVDEERVYDEISKHDHHPSILSGKTTWAWHLYITSW